MAEVHTCPPYWFPTPKDPEESLDYELKWRKFMGPEDTIVTSTWEVEAGLTLVSHSHTTTIAKIEVAGGLVGVTYKMKNRIVASSGRIFVRRAMLTIGER